MYAGGVMAEELTAKKLAFCEEYLKDLNATQAAIRAGYSEKTAASQAARLLINVNIQSKIAELKQERSQRVQIDADWVLQQLKDIHNLDVIDILDNYGNFKKIVDWPKPWRMYLSGFDLQELIKDDVETVIRKIKWPDKVKNLELIGKHVSVQAFNEKVTSEVTHKVDKSLADRLLGGSKR